MSNMKERTDGFLETAKCCTWCRHCYYVDDNVLQCGKTERNLKGFTNAVSTSVCSYYEWRY